MNIKERTILKKILKLNDVELLILKEIPTWAKNTCKEILKEHEKGKPLEYILKEAYFSGLYFYVDENVLIPRLETEILVQCVAYHINELKGKVSILDLCTGSGCVLISVLNLTENAKGCGIDISESALIIAEKNAKSNNIVNIKFMKNDMLENIKNKYDVIVSNPPYIKTDEIANLEKTVTKYEPHIALDGGYDGLYFYKYIRENFHNNLNKNGTLFMEIGHDQGEAIKSLFDGYKVVIKKDYSGFDRIAVIYT